MKFIVDHQLPPALTRWLAARGHDAEHVFVLGLGEADDGQIWDVAVGQDAVVLTKDRDFAERRAWAGQGPVVVWLRPGNSSTPKLLEWLDTRWLGVETALANAVPVIEVR